MTVNPLSWADPDPVAPALRLVPDLPPAPLGADVLPAEAPLDQEVLVRRVVPVTHDVVRSCSSRPVPAGSPSPRGSTSPSASRSTAATSSAATRSPRPRPALTC